MRISKVVPATVFVVALVGAGAYPALAEYGATTPGAYAYTSGNYAKANIKDTSANGTPVYTNYYRGATLYRLENNSGAPNTVTGASGARITAIRACQNVAAAPDPCSAFTP